MYERSSDRTYFHYSVSSIRYGERCDLTMQTLLILVYLLITPLLFHFAICGTIQTRSDLDQGLLVISYDAFRPEYLNRNVTPNLNKFRNDGTSAPYMQNVFPTKTFVNHHSMATGFYAEEHGVTANAFFDSALGPLDYSYDLFHYDESIVPIWVRICEKSFRCKDNRLN